MESPFVSVVIPARDAAATLGETLRSLHAQTFADWEAIVIDDGSRDATAEVAAGTGGTGDPRVRVERAPGLGVSAARNAGLGLARAPWLLFLDADDWIEPRHLERMTAALDGVDGALCGWRFAAPDGRLGPERHCPEDRGLAGLLATHCPFAIHACLVRRALVESVGGFDPGLTTCEDWDLWQRIARAGARFARVPEPLAVYRMRPDSASRDPGRLLADGLRVIERGQGSRSAGLLFACWVAGLALGRGEPPPPLPEGPREPGLDSEAVARNLFQAVPLPGARLPGSWGDLWPRIEGGLDAFLQELEGRSGAAGLAPRSRRALERMAVEASGASIGATHVLRLEVTEPVPDLRLPEVEHLRAVVAVEGETLGIVELPAIGGHVPAEVLADAVAAGYAWEILRRFLDRRAPGRFGWDVFLQDLWARPGWPMGHFYDPAAIREKAPRQRVEGDFELDVAGELPEVETAGPAAVLPRVGGSVIGRVPLPAGAVIGPHELRAAITQAGGFELCRAAVRDGILGRPFEAPGSLRERLAGLFRRGGACPRPGGGRPDREEGGDEPRPYENCILGRPPGSPIGSAPSRRARLPAEALPELRDLAEAVGQPLFEGAKGAGHVVYEPNLLPCAKPEGQQRQQGLQGHGLLSVPAVPASLYSREHFETLFAAEPDPWRYTSPYEETKYRQTLALLPPGAIGRALELACAEGHFTVRLAPRVGRLIAADISRIALERAGERCAGLANVAFRQLDLTRDELPDGLDLIVCSEVLYFLDGLATLRAAARRFARALAPGGWLLTAHANLVADDPDRAGFDWPYPFGARVIGETLRKAGGLRLVRELRTPLYRVQLFRKPEGSLSRLWAPAPEIAETAELPPLPSRVAERVLWQGGAPRPWGSPTVSTHRLPILMFHRVAPEGAESTARWRLTPEAFEERLRFLRDSGYHTPCLQDWRRAMQAHEPLPGRAVILTFDDGCRDFAEHAWPLLRRHGFSALVFLVSDHVGGTNRWDAAYGEEVPLLGWDEIRRLRGEGVEFGSHAASHRPLTSLDFAGVVREAARSRTALTRGLGTPADAIAWPHGAVDPTVRHLAGACGYVYGLSCRPGRCGLDEPLLDLPRVEVSGTDPFDAFVRSLANG